ncbi:MAG: glycosyltransferase [Lachnospiraceae bacterium]|nr:glycosyltransferase [Lachnospiraceae bacterium]
MKKALLITRVSGFIPQFEMNDVKILQEMGYEVHYAANFHEVVYGKDNSRLEGTGIIQHQIDFYRLPSPGNLHKAYKQLKKLMLKGDFDLIHCHMPMSAAVARVAANKVRRMTGKNVPVLYTAHGFHFYTGAPLKNWIFYPIEKHLARYTDRLILINNEDYKRACDKFKVRGSVERIMGIGMDLKKLEKTIEEEKMSDFDIHEKYNIDKKNAVIVSVGELTHRKNNIVMLRAMKELLDLDITYVICGKGPMEEELKKEAKELGVEDHVRFAGYVFNVYDILSQADCFVFPSLQEGLPVAVMEAMAMGLPVIATDIRGIRDLIKHSKGGYLVNDFEPENYAVKIRRMFTDEYRKSKKDRALRRKEMGEWNKKRIKKFSLEIVDKKMRQIYESVDKQM